jgi:hypothetical protein
VGTFNAYITLEEYKYLIESGATVKIIKAWYLRIAKKSYPYRKAVDRLYKIKEESKGKDIMIYYLAKTMLNSFYGKMVQLIQKPNGKIIAGIGWNILYGAIITANVRIKISRLQRELRKDCLAVHTDSVITLKPIPESYIGSGIGDFQLAESGSGLIIACGMYEIGKKSADRGFILPHSQKWSNIIGDMGNASTLKLPQTLVISWISALHQDKPELVNQFIQSHKILTLNCESKRNWLTTTNADKLLSGLEYSIPKVVLDRLNKKYGG